MHCSRERWQLDVPPHPPFLHPARPRSAEAHPAQRGRALPALLTSARRGSGGGTNEAGCPCRGFWIYCGEGRARAGPRDLEGRDARRERGRRDAARGRAHALREPPSCRSRPRRRGCFWNFRITSFVILRGNNRPHRSGICSFPLAGALQSVTHFAWAGREKSPEGRTKFN